VKSKVDPRRDPAGFRRAGESALRSIYIGDRDDRTVTPGSGSAGSASPPPVNAP
jgi:hypothetical protein